MCLLVSVRHTKYAIVFVLSTAVVCVEEGVLLSKAVVQSTYYSIGALAAIPCLIRQEIHLPRYCFTIDAEHCALTWSKKVNRARLQRIRRIVHLLGVIKGVVHFYLL